MTRFVDLSHVFEDGMPGFRMRNPDGTVTQFTARIRALRTHEQSRVSFGGKAEFESTEMSFQTSLGTYIDSPYVRFRDKRDVAALELDELILPGVLIDLSELEAGQAASVDDLQVGGGPALDVNGKAVLCRFGWDRHWGEEAYYRYPFLSREALRFLIDGGARLVGVDTINIDDGTDQERPAHTWLLERDIFVVENLCNLAVLADEGRPFRFFGLPIRARGAGSMPIRAFAELGRVSAPGYKFLEQ